MNFRCGGFQAVDRAAVHIDADVRFPLPGSGLSSSHERRAKSKHPPGAVFLSLGFPLRSDVMSDHRYRPEVETLSVTDTGRRWRWTDAQKVRIVEESFGQRGSLSETARRHDIGRTLLVCWRRQYRDGELAGCGCAAAVHAFDARGP